MCFHIFFILVFNFTFSIGDPIFNYVKNDITQRLIMMMVMMMMMMMMMMMTS